jgi:hypothetical protein
MSCGRATLKSRINAHYRTAHEGPEMGQSSRTGCSARDPKEDLRATIEGQLDRDQARVRAFESENAVLVAPTAFGRIKRGVRRDNQLVLGNHRAAYHFAAALETQTRNKVSQLGNSCPKPTSLRI